MGIPPLNSTQLDPLFALRSLIVNGSRQAAAGGAEFEQFLACSFWGFSCPCKTNAKETTSANTVLTSCKPVGCHAHNPGEDEAVLCLPAGRPPAPQPRRDPVLQCPLPWPAPGCPWPPRHPQRSPGPDPNLDALPTDPAPRPLRQQFRAGDDQTTNGLNGNARKHAHTSLRPPQTRTAQTHAARPLVLPRPSVLRRRPSRRPLHVLPPGPPLRRRKRPRPHLLLHCIAQTSAARSLTSHPAEPT